MNKFRHRASELTIKEMKGELTPEEEVELKAMGLEEVDWGKELSLIEGLKERLDEKVFANDRSLADAGSSVAALPRNDKRVRRIWWAAAASVILLLSAYFLIKSGDRGPKTEVAVNKDVEAPKVTKAQITLADGRVVSIDELKSIDQGSVKITKTEDGKITYSGAATEAVYNTLTNPRGSKVIDMTLADGSRVWLNAGSSVTYPVAFVGHERKVTMTGEGYFEVSKDLSKKFIVDANGTTTEVLGTHFNVNAYKDEGSVKVTLLEGSVKVKDVILKPGQQAINDGQVSVSNNVNIEQVMAWKNGVFIFNNSSVDAIMRQVARWYDVDVEFEDKIEEKLNGIIPRDVSAANLFKILELTGEVHFKIEGKKVIVKK